MNRSGGRDRATTVELFEQAGLQIVNAVKDGACFSAVLNDFLNEHIGRPMNATSTSVRDSDGNLTGVFPSIIAASDGESEVRAEAVACIIYPAELLTTVELRRAYDSISVVKKLKKSAPPKTGLPRTDTPLGIVCALESDQSLEDIANEVQKLNSSYSSTEWPDMIVVLSRGTLNYAAQIEGDQIRGDMLLPNHGGAARIPIYVHLVGRSLGSKSFNRMCYLLFMQLQVFCPGINVPDKDAVIKGVSQFVLTYVAYYFDPQGKLLPVPAEMYRERGAGLGNLPYRIESANGKLLAHVAFVSWPEGGAIRIVGKIPLEMCLLFLGALAKGAQRFKTPDGEVSSVLPISQGDFRNMLLQLGKRSNVKVLPEQPKWVVSKFADEGSTSPFMARLFMGICRLRDIVFREMKSRKSFDDAHHRTLTWLMSARTSAQEIVKLVSEHKLSVQRGEAAEVRGKSIHVNGIDKELRKSVEDFLVVAARTLKHGVQDVTKSLNLNIGCLFKQQRTFETGVAAIAKYDPELASYLREVRQWSEPLIDHYRNGLEHGEWELPRFTYTEQNGAVAVSEPTIGDKTVSDYVIYIVDRLCCAVEELTVHGLKLALPPDLSIADIAAVDRDPNMPERFHPVLAEGGTPHWRLSYHRSLFHET